MPELWYWIEVPSAKLTEMQKEAKRIYPDQLKYAISLREDPAQVEKRKVLIGTWVDLGLNFLGITL